MADDLDTRVVPLAFSRWLPSWASASAYGGRWIGGARGAALLVAACAWLLWLGWSDETPPTPLARASLAPPALPSPPPAPIRLDDGSVIALRAASSTLQREEISSARVRLRLSGGARFSVAPNAARNFAVANAQVLVSTGPAVRPGGRVLATAFSVDPEGARTRVVVERGRVQVIWWSGATVLGEGESAAFPPEDEPAFARPGFFALAERSEKSEERAKKHAKKHRRARTSASVR